MESKDDFTQAIQEMVASVTQQQSGEDQKKLEEGGEVPHQLETPSRRRQRDPSKPAHQGAVRQAVHFMNEAITNVDTQTPIGLWNNTKTGESVRMYFDKRERGWFNKESFKLNLKRPAVIKGLFFLPKKRRAQALTASRFPLPNQNIRFSMGSKTANNKRLAARIQKIVQHPRASKRVVLFVLESLQISAE